MVSKISLFFLIFFFILNHEPSAHSLQSENKNISINYEFSVGVGIVLNMESWLGKSIHRCITMAISDFYALNHSYRTRIVLHTKNSKGDPIEALSAVDHLLNNEEVQAIIGPETQLQSKLLALFADKAKVPIFSFAGMSSVEHPYLFQIKEEESTIAKIIAALVEPHKMRNVIFVHEDSDDGRDILPYLLDSFQDQSIRISYRCAISATATNDEITKELRKLKTFHTPIIILHMSPSLASSLFVNAKSLRMVKEEYAWILSEKTVDVMRSTNFDVIDSLQGALGIRSSVPASSRLYNLTERWQKFIYRQYQTSVTKEVPAPAIRAYDTIWALAESFEKVGATRNGALLLNEVLKVRFKGVSGEFQLCEGKVCSNGYEIISAIDYGEKKVGRWTESEGLKKADLPINGNQLYSGFATPTTKLKIGVLKIKNFKHFMDVNHDIEKNVTTATGFSIDVFNACLGALQYNVTYELIAYDNATYDHLVQKVFNQEIDAVVGDSTILANRSEYVSFTATYTDLGVGTLARIKKKDIWFFLKPLDIGLVLSATGSLIVTGFIIWVIECMYILNGDAPAFPSIRTIFWLMLMTIFFAHGDKLRGFLSKCVLFIWLLVVLILVAGYNATLSSLLTLEQFELASKGGIVGFHGGSFMKGVTVSNLHFENHKHRPFYSYEAYADALSDDGDADAIVDEIPYLKMFLGKYPGGYGLVSTQPITSGFGFIFQKGSPLAEDVSREIAKMRFDGTLRGLEKKWFENGLTIPSRNSTEARAMNLDKFGGLFIINAIFFALILIIAIIYKFHEIPSIFIAGMHSPEQDSL